MRLKYWLRKINFPNFEKFLRKLSFVPFILHKMKNIKFFCVFRIISHPHPERSEDRAALKIFGVPHYDTVDAL